MKRPITLQAGFPIRYNKLQGVEAEFAEVDACLPLRQAQDRLKGILAKANEGD